MGIEKAMSWQTTNLGGGGLVFNEEVDTDGFDLTFHATNAVNFIDVSGNIIDAGGIIKTGAGTLTLAGTNTYSGGTTVSEGILQIGDNGTTGSITGNITNNAALIFNRTNSYTYAGVISGTGTFEQAGSGSTIFTGANIYSGGTTISAGTLQIGNAGTLEIASGGNLTIDGLGGSLSGGDPTGGFTGTLDVDGIMTLNGGLISSGSGAGSTGELILTATNTLEIASNFTFGTVGTTGCGDQLGTLTLQDSTRLVISGGNTVNIGTLNIDGDSVIDFTSAESNTLNLGSLTFTTGSSLVIDGWNS
jgi:fibronectin-binding autotransporter adhesin